MKLTLLLSNNHDFWKDIVLYLVGYVVSIVSLFKIIVNYIFNKNDLKDSNKILNNIIKHKERDKEINDNISNVLNSINLEDSEENNIKK